MPWLIARYKKFAWNLILYGIFWWRGASTIIIFSNYWQNMATRCIDLFTDFIFFPVSRVQSTKAIMCVFASMFDHFLKICKLCKSATLPHFEKNISPPFHQRSEIPTPAFNRNVFFGGDRVVAGTCIDLPRSWCTRGSGWRCWRNWAWFLAEPAIELMPLKDTGTGTLGAWYHGLGVGMATLF